MTRGFGSPKVSKCHKPSMQALRFLSVRRCLLSVQQLTEEEEEEASSNSPKQIMHSTNTFEHALILLKHMVNKHVFMNLVSWFGNK